MNKIKILFLSLTMLVLSFIFASSSYAIVLLGNGPWGSFEGILTYSVNTASSAILTVALKNTSPVGNGGYLTAFVFNNPGNKISAILLSSSDPDFGLLGGPNFNNGIEAPPYGDFDIGVSTSSDFLGNQGGSGPASNGIAVGVNETFTFALTGTNLGLLSDSSFANTWSADPQGGGAQFFVARFRGFNNGESNKVPAEVIPEPASLSLLGLGLLGLLARKKPWNAII